MRFHLLGALLLLALPGAWAAEASMLGGFFSPGRLSVEPGEAVTWTNDDDVAHTVTSSWDGGASFDVVLRPGESFTHRFGEPGVYAVHCRPHAHLGDGDGDGDGDGGGYEGMAMVVEVQEAAASGVDRGGWPVALAGGLSLIGLVLLAGRQRWTRRPTRPPA